MRVGLSQPKVGGFVLVQYPFLAIALGDKMKKPKRTKKKLASVMAAVESGNVEGVRAAVAAGVGLLDEMEDTSPLALAVQKNDVKMVEVLLRLGHRPDLGGTVVPLALAARNGDKRIAGLLLGGGIALHSLHASETAAQSWSKPESRRVISSA